MTRRDVDGMLMSRCLSHDPGKHLDGISDMFGAVRRLRDVARCYPPPPKAIEMRRSTFDAIPKAKPDAGILSSMFFYTGIPVVIDPSLPHGAWRLK